MESMNPPLSLSFAASDIYYKISVSGDFIIEF